MVVDSLKFFYEGAFVAKDLFNLIGTYFYDKGYDKKQEKDFEHLNKTGKHAEWQIAPWKKVTDYQRLEIRMVILMDELTKKDVVIDKKKKKIDYGKVTIIISAYTETDYDLRWEEKPMFLFMRTLYDKFIFPMYSKRWEHLLHDHVNQLYSQVHKFFNVYSLQDMGTIPPSTLTHQHQELS